MRRSERIQRKKHPIVPTKKQQRKRSSNQEPEQKVIHARRGGWYDRYYKPLLILPLLLLVLAIAVIAIQTATTGDFIHRGVNLKGGLVVTISSPTVDGELLAQRLRLTFPDQDIESRTLESAGSQVAVTISSDLDPADDRLLNTFLAAVAKGAQVPQDELSTETIGSSLGATFFQQTSKALFIAFLFMGLVVFLYFSDAKRVKFIAFLATLVASIFMYNVASWTNIVALLLGVAIIGLYARYNIPSVAVILAAFSDIVVTLAVIDLMGMKLSTAGIAAFLMLIGYSVDTDILLSTRVLKRSGGTVYDRIVSAVKTGLTMNFTTMAAVVVALILAESEVITQIMTILLIGLLADMINTWFQNAGILRWHLERVEQREKKGVRA